MSVPSLLRRAEAFRLQALAAASPGRAVIYGAGNIGRGFIGQLFAASGCRITFIDQDDSVVSALASERTYPVRIIRETGGFEEVWVTNVRAIGVTDEAAVAEAIASADIMATAVGVRALPRIAPLIAGGLERRFKTAAKPLNIIVCENLLNAGEHLAGLVAGHRSKSARALVPARAGFVEASIGRMVPLQTDEMQGGNALRVCTEPYAFLPVNAAAVVGVMPAVKGMIACERFEFYIERKLFIHNMGHASAAYLGLCSGDTYLAGAVARPEVLCITGNAMHESAAALSRKHGVASADIMSHVRDLLCRFGNRGLGDTTARVGADIERKLGGSDRFIGAMLVCRQQGVTPAFIASGAAAALLCLVRDRGLGETEENAVALLAEVSGLPDTSAEAALILSLYRVLLKEGVSGLLRSALVMGRKAGVM